MLMAAYAGPPGLGHESSMTAKVDPAWASRRGIGYAAAAAVAAGCAAYTALAAAVSEAVAVAAAYTLTVAATGAAHATRMGEDNLEAKIANYSSLRC